jgi:hypothetical protein
MNTMGFDAHAVRQSSNSLSANIVALHKQRITNHALAHGGGGCMELAIRYISFSPSSVVGLVL